MQVVVENLWKLFPPEGPSAEDLREAQAQADAVRRQKVGRPSALISL